MTPFEAVRVCSYPPITPGPLCFNRGSLLYQLHVYAILVTGSTSKIAKPPYDATSESQLTHFCSEMTLQVWCLRWSFGSQGSGDWAGCGYALLGGIPGNWVTTAPTDSFMFQHNLGR
jgi:hypothetical protein